MTSNESTKLSKFIKAVQNSERRKYPAPANEQIDATSFTEFLILFLVAYQQKLSIINAILGKTSRDISNNSDGTTTWVTATSLALNSATFFEPLNDEERYANPFIYATELYLQDVRTLLSEDAQFELTVYIAFLSGELPERYVALFANQIRELTDKNPKISAESLEYNYVEDDEEKAVPTYELSIKISLRELQLLLTTISEELYTIPFIVDALLQAVYAVRYKNK